MRKVINESEIRITYTYGWHPEDNYMHNGVDLGWRIDEEQNKVYPNCKGVVIAILDNVPHMSEQGGGWGNYVLIKHPNGMCSRYAHLQNGVKVSVGQEVDENTLLGIIGNTGRAEYRHLHFEVANNENASSRIDPTPYLTKAIYEEPTPSPEPTPVPPITLKYKEGDRVIFNGTLYGTAFMEAPGQSRENYICTITDTYKNGTAPYNIDNGLGWVTEDSLTLYVEPQPTPEEPIKVGDWVVPIKKIDYYGTSVVQYDDTYQVTELVGDRAVLCALRDEHLVTWCAMNINNIKKA